MKWIHISDMQFGQVPNAEEQNRLNEELIARVRNQKPDFVVNSGDLVSHMEGFQPGVRDEDKFVAQCWRDYHRVIDPLAGECPVLCCPGNHDQTRPGRSLENYCKNVGRAGKPPYFAKTFGDIHVVMLDQVLRTGEHDWEDNVTTRLSHMGGFLPGSAQDRWLRRHLSKARRARVKIAVGHWPIFAPRTVYHDTDSSLRYDEMTKHPGVLLPQLIEARFDLYLCGHHHVYERSRHPKLMQVKTGANGIAFPGVMRRPNQYFEKHDYRQGYTRFVYDPSANKIHGEAVALDGDIMDAWSQSVKG